MAAVDDRRDRWRRNWDRSAPGCDKAMDWADRYLFRDSRTWVCSRAAGATLEVAVGTGLNLPFYPEQVELTGIDFSPGMLAIARRRASQLGREADLREADALALPFPDGSFDTVVGTYALCAIPDDRAAVAEMSRVLRPGGLLLLADHVAASAWPLRAIQRASEKVAIALHGEHFTRRPLRHVEAEGLRVEEHERFLAGIAERLAARKPAANPA
jgi:ubiquinone/menaquinone biosynthesis C-methylase UbiE